MKLLSARLLALGFLSILCTYGCIIERTADTSDEGEVYFKAEPLDKSAHDDAIVTSPIDDQKATPSVTAGQMTDARDGHTYATVHINGVHWMKENLDFDLPGALLMPERPEPSYGRLYPVDVLSEICPDGWRMPTDSEWDALEVYHGMPISFLGKGGWRGEHSVALRSAEGWAKGHGGTDVLGFSVLPAGYYFDGAALEESAADWSFDGLGYSAGFWSSTAAGVTQARFLFGERAFVNKWADTDGDSKAALSCRCVEE